MCPTLLHHNNGTRDFYLIIMLSVWHLDKALLFPLLLNKRRPARPRQAPTIDLDDSNRCASAPRMKALARTWAKQIRSTT